MEDAKSEEIEGKKMTATAAVAGCWLAGFLLPFCTIMQSCLDIDWVIREHEEEKTLKLKSS